MLGDYFAGTTETLILVGKKNGKTSLVAALSLFHLLTTPDAECVIAAASRDQAAIMLRQARGFVRRSPALQQRVAIKQREIVNLVDEGRVRIMAADADTADGVLPTLALVDELHRHKSADLYGVFRDGLGPRDGRLITISTAGDDEDSPLGVMRAAAYKLPVVERDGAYRNCRSASGDYVLHEWSLEPTDDLDDVERVKLANPAPWQTIEALRRRHESPSMTPWQWARFACGVWVSGENAWLDAADWDACQGDVDLEEGASVWLGVDIGQVRDSSAVVTVGWVDDRLHIACRAWEPPPEVELLEVEAHIGCQAETFDVAEVAFDPWRFKRSAEILEERGLRLVEFPQTQGRMAQASSVLYDLIREGKVVHDGDELLRRHVLAGVAVETESGWRVSKKKSGKRIDACIALILATSRALHGQTQADLLVEVFS